MDLDHRVKLLFLFFFSFTLVCSLWTLQLILVFAVDSLIRSLLSLSRTHTGSLRAIISRFSP